MKNKFIKMSLLIAGVSSNLLSAEETSGGVSSDAGIAFTVQELFRNGKTVMMAGLLIAALYGAYLLFIKDEKKVINWFLLIGGAGGIGAYDSITRQIVAFIK